MKTFLSINRKILLLFVVLLIINISEYNNIITMLLELIFTFLLVLFTIINLLFYCKIKKQNNYPLLLPILSVIAVYLFHYIAAFTNINDKLSPALMRNERDKQRFDSIAKYHPEMLIWRDSLLNVQAVLKKQLDSLEKQEYILLADTIQKKTIKGRKKIVECKEKQVQLKHSIEDINRYFREKL